MSNTKKLFSQIIKFGFVGGTAFVIDAGLLFLLTEFCGIHYLISGMISFTASVIYNYILSVKWVFDAKKDIITLIRGIYCVYCVKRDRFGKMTVVYVSC